jgi:hypothetical protein
VGGRKTTFFSAGNRERVIRDKRFQTRATVRPSVRPMHGRIAVAPDLETIETSGFFDECTLLTLQLFM